MAVTIHDVARRARVSVTTVSRALTQPNLLRRETRQRVLAIAKELAYQPNRAARGLITGKTGSIGIVVPDLANPFYPGVLRGVQVRALQLGHAVLLADSDENADAEGALVNAMEKQVDGVILCAPFSSDSQLHRIAASTPIVLLNRRCGDIPAVLMDIARGMREAVSHLRELGHRHIAYLGGPRNAWSNRERLRGLHAAVRGTDITLFELGPFEPKFDGGIAGAALAIDAGVTAIIAYNDLMALGALRCLMDQGLHVPGDMSVVGFDDLLFASMSAPPLTTVAMPMEAAGGAAVEMLLGGAGMPAQPQRTELTAHLVVRGTTAAPAAGRRLVRAMPSAALQRARSSSPSSKKR
jgi:DNA-binding LacI/PurR family transcriptional regulator